MKVHPLAAVFPPLPDNRLRELGASIAEIGLLDPIVILEDQILDGRNRYWACELAGVEPRFRQYEGSDPAAFVKGKNLERRNLSPGQRIAIVLKLEGLLAEYRAEAKRSQGSRTDLSLPGDESSKDVLKRVA